MAAKIESITKESVFAQLPQRAADANKGSCGSVVAVAGSLRYRGAAALCTEGALRSGAGLVYLAAPEAVLQLVLTRTPECCALPCNEKDGGIAPESAAAIRADFAAKKAVLLAGPGLGPTAGAVCGALLAAPHGWQAAVLDADALNALAANQIAAPLPHSCILTPHPGEAARLLRCTVAEIQADRPAAAKALAEKYGCTAVLKGHETLVATPEGTLYRNQTGNAGLAKGGSGDVLAGMAAALLAQGLACTAAACCAVWLHGAAADACAAHRGMANMLPHDILEDLGSVLLAAER